MDLKSGLYRRFLAPCQNQTKFRLGIQRRMEVQTSQGCGRKYPAVVTCLASTPSPSPWQREHLCTAQCICSQTSLISASKSSYEIVFIKYLDDTAFGDAEVPRNDSHGSAVPRHPEATQSYQ